MINEDSDRKLFAVIRETLYTPVVGDILDNFGHTKQFLPQKIRPLSPTMKIVGRAMPVLISDVYGVQEKPYGLLTEALDQLLPNEIYVASAAVQPVAMWGELLTAAAKYRGAVGALIDGYYRDTPQILEQDFPVFGWGSSGEDSSLRSVVQGFRTEIEIGGVKITPGDLIFGDIDGVLVIPREVEAEVIELALSKVGTENEILAQITAGMSATEAFSRYGIL